MCKEFMTDNFRIKGRTPLPLTAGSVRKRKNEKREEALWNKRGAARLSAAFYDNRINRGYDRIMSKI